MKTYLQFISEGVDDGLYTFRKLNAYSSEYLYEWMRENHVPNPIPYNELHCTVVASEGPVEGYSPDPASVMVSPATYQIRILNNALTICFRHDALEEQWQRAMNLGAKSKWPTFIPHVSLSYQVPLDFDAAELKPPPIFLVFNEEICRKLMPGKEYIDSVSEGSEGIGQMGLGGGPEIYIPQNSLKIPRHEMPQIASGNTMEFVDWLEAQGIVVRFIDIPVALLRSVQDEIDVKRVSTMANSMTDKVLGKPLIISKDNYILDGHHRWLAVLNRDPHYAIDAYRVELPIRDLLDKARQYGKSFYKDIVNQPVTA